MSKFNYDLVLNVTGVDDNIGDVEASLTVSVNDTGLIKLSTTDKEGTLSYTDNKTEELHKIVRTVMQDLTKLRQFLVMMEGIGLLDLPQAVSPGKPELKVVH